MHHGCHCFIMAEQLQGLPYTLLHLLTAHQHNHIIISQSHHHKIIISSYVSFKNKMVMVEILMMDMKEIRQWEVGERGGGRGCSGDSRGIFTYCSNQCNRHIMLCILYF